MNVRTIILEILTILSSFSTLVCCALPAALVTIGAGAALASVVTAVPQLVWLSEHKIPLFAFAGLMLVLSGVSAYRNRNAPCPADPAQAKSCMRLRRWSARIFYFSAVLYVIGFFFAFLACPGPVETDSSTQCQSRYVRRWMGAASVAAMRVCNPDRSPVGINR